MIGLPLLSVGMVMIILATLFSIFGIFTNSSFVGNYLMGIGIVVLLAGVVLIFIDARSIKGK